MKKILIILGIVLLAIVLTLAIGNTKDKTNDFLIGEEFTTGQQIDETFTVMSFNIQVFGITKVAKVEVTDILVDIIMQYDLVAIQEVRDASGTSVVLLMDMLPPNYSYFIGPREGRSSSKEQYLFIWNKNVFNMIESYVFSDSYDWFERDPLAVCFETYNGGVDFVIINNHISPSSAEEEIPHLLDVVAEINTYFDEDDIILVGDFNADGSYFDEDELIDVFQTTEYVSIIPNSVNTTVAKSSNTYDRVIATNTFLEDYTGNWGVYVFQDYYDFDYLSIEPKHVSDHYPVWIEIYNNRDTD